MFSFKRITISGSVFLALLLSASIWAKPVQAGADLTVTCQDQGPCDVSPSWPPLFYDENLAPGQTTHHAITTINQDADDTCELVLNTQPSKRSESFESFVFTSLAERLFVGIVDPNQSFYGTMSGPEAVGPETYQTLFSQSNIPLGDLNPQSTRVFTWYATFDKTAGNEYQNQQTVFDIDLNFSCSPEPSPTPSPGSPSSTSSNSSSSSNGGGGGGGSVLGAVTGGGLPSLFGRIGRAVEEVLGSEIQYQEGASPSAEVAGVTTDVCQNWKIYLPLIFLLLEVVGILLVELLLRDPKSRFANLKPFLQLAITLGTMLAFYWLRECDCGAERSWLTILCQYYAIVAIVVALIVKLLGQLVMEDESESPL